MKATNKDTLADRIGALKHLQSIDNRIIELTTKKETLLDVLEKSRNQIRQERELLIQKQKESKNLQGAIDGKELDLKCLEEEIKKLRGRLFQIKNNKEYSVLLSEIGSREADKSVLEDEILSMLTNQEGSNAEERGLSKKIQEEEKGLTAYSHSVEVELGVLEKEIEVAQRQWKENAELLDSEALTQYRRLIEKDGLAVVEVDGENCGGCNMSLTPQTINLLLRRQEIIFCMNCGKILCLPEA